MYLRALCLVLFGGAGFEDGGCPDHHQNGALLLQRIPYLPGSRPEVCFSRWKSAHLHPLQGGAPWPTEEEGSQTPLDIGTIVHSRLLAWLHAFGTGVVLAR